MTSLSGPANIRTEGKLFISAIEDKARWIPNHTFMRYPPKDWETKGYQSISYGQWSNAIDKVAFWLDSQLGKVGDSGTVAYFGPNDARYAIITPAVIKSGRRILIPDGRNTSDGLKALIASTDCKVWIYAEDDARGPSIDSSIQLQTCALPSLDWMLSPNEHGRYPYDKTFEQDAHEVIVIIHTSGTTGLPKPIYQTNGYWSTMGNVHALSKRYWPRGLAYDSWIGKPGINCCAPQWLAGIMNMTGFPVFMDSPCIMLPPDAVSMSPELFKKIMSMNLVEGIKCPPQTIHTLYEDSEARAMLKSLPFIMYLGAALDRSIGDDLCQYTRLTPLIGSTENGEQISVRPANRELWYTHDFVAENGSKMVPIDSTSEELGNLHELVLERSAAIQGSSFQAAFWNPASEGLDRIETKELYAPILDSDGRTRWVFTARKDDLTKLSWLAKFHAQDIETRIQKHSDIKSVIVGGEGRPTPYVIVETKEGVLDGKNEEELLEDLYETMIVGTNKADITEIRIPRETVFVAKKEKPFRRNLKQVILRRGVEEDYREEIEQAYLQLEKVQGAGTSK